MHTRAQVYSPLQNTAVWLAAWLYNVESTDETIDALTDLGGTHTFDGAPMVQLLHDVRTAADLESPEPAVRLVLWGPGQAPRLRADSPAMEALTQAGALVVRGGGANHILVPDYSADGVRWRWFEDYEPLPEPEWLTPGEADQLLSRATNEAAVLIEAAGGTRKELPNPRLAVGTLADFYDTPGLPAGVTPRAAKLFARADRVAATIETVTERLDDHTFDPHLFALWRHVRSARMAGVSDAVVDYRREYMRA
ncbi:hypothetical protein [Corynebacterium lujinxingii]|uniref:Uncharacterized protein n=1 Tax=Corynebacterium lujinxingii TaxID=2763010 RepID=A0A7H0JW73_9CORY|nr:hypothetical protein [Corynebacterium lujinxingii]MBC3178776.1 hypothetical protein [Corynebacterium lujinxingii]NNO11058.1 hypothetical protein [Corynebacterium lujinxingii]QNP89289.1 hypothetical protein IAU68_06055 [Corynebacterium lujinxingii]